MPMLMNIQNLSVDLKEAFALYETSGTSLNDLISDHIAVA